VDARALTGRSLETLSYDLIAIGSGPAGQGAAIQAAKLGKRAALVERQGVLGGTSTNSGTIPSKTLRAAVVELRGRSQGIYRRPYRGKTELTSDDLLWRAQLVIEQEQVAIQDALRRNLVDVLNGKASFVDAHTIQITSQEGFGRAAAERFVIAVGTKPSRPPGVDFDDRVVIDSDGILGLTNVPQTLTVVGASPVGLEYVSIAAALGTQVTLVDRRRNLLDFVDVEIVETLSYYLAGIGVVFRLGDEVTAVERMGQGVATCLQSGERIPSDLVLYAASRRGATGELDLAAAGLQADPSGRIAVDADLRTAQRHIFAAGDVIGFPNLAATAMEQGRLAALAAFGEPVNSNPALLPYGMYTIPEISFLGARESELAAAGIPYVRGVARYREFACGEIAGDRTGFLKLLVHAETREVLGIHIFGTSATELIHVGQTVMASGLPVDYLADAVFNVPSFAGAYKVAALEATSRLKAIGARPNLAAD
jgi:NAD(P) transhydrogenase